MPHGHKHKNNSKTDKARFPIFSAYSKALSGARHHALIQANYHVIASGWLLGIFSAIGYLITIDQFLPFNHLIGVAFICLIGIIGIYFLWYEAAIVQELLLDMSVVEGVALEQKYSWLPQLHHTFLMLDQKKRANFVKVVFFIGCKTILILMMAIALSIYFYPQRLTLMIVTIMACLIFNYISSKFMFFKKARIDRFMEYLAHADNRRT